MQNWPWGSIFVKLQMQVNPIPNTTLILKFGLISFSVLFVLHLQMRLLFLYKTYMH